MNILFVSIAWPKPDERNLYSDLMEEFVKQGNEVYVLCADEIISGDRLCVENGISILRSGNLKVRKVNKLRKAIALFTLGMKLERVMLKHWADIKVDLIISHSPPVTFSWMLKSFKRRFDVPMYYLLKDIWPHGPADLGLIRKYGVIYYFFRYHEKRIYKTADFIGCMSPMNVEYILKNNDYLTREKVEVCPNSISPRNLIIKEDITKIRAKHEIPEQATVFIFSGNLGKAHGLNFYLSAIEKLKNFDKAYFLIGGGGMYYNYVKNEINKRKLTNVITYRRLPAEDFDQLLLASDVGVILLDSKYTVPQFPSRLLAYLEAGKPVLCSVNKTTDIGTIIEDAGCGISTIHGDTDSFIQAVQHFCDTNHSEEINKMGINSFALLHQNYTSANSYNIIAEHFKR